MFRIADGREQFYQWDLDRQVIVEDPSIVEVHFCNRTDDCSLVTEVVNGVANVPNILLQKSFDIRVFGYDGKATLHDKKFKVNARTKPSDYIYTETEIRNFDALTERAEEAIELAEDSATQARDFAESATTTATELYEFVEGHRLDLKDDGQGNVHLEAVEVGEGEVTPNALRNYYTKAETNERIEEAIESIPEPDLTGYAKLEDLPDVSDFISEIPSEYITESELEAKGYLTEHQDISGKADKVHSHPEYLTSHQDISHLAPKTSIPTKVSQLTNDRNYISSIPSEYITENELSAKGYLVQSDLNDYAKKSELPEGADLSEYAKKTDLPTVPTKVSAFENDKGYLTEHQSLAGYATETYVGTAIQDALNNIGVAEGGSY